MNERPVGQAPAERGKSKKDLEQTVYGEFKLEGNVLNFSHDPREHQINRLSENTKTKEPTEDELLGSSESGIRSFLESSQRGLQQVEAGQKTIKPGRPDPVKERARYIESIKNAENELTTIQEGQAALHEGLPTSRAFNDMVFAKWVQASNSLTASQQELAKGRTIPDSTIAHQAAELRTWHKLQQKLSKPN